MWRWGTGLRGVVLSWAWVGLAVCACGAPAPVSLIKGATISFEDLTGRRFVNAQVMRIEPGALVVMTGEGVVRVPVSQLPEALRAAHGGAGGSPDVGTAPSPAVKSGAEVALAHVDARIREKEQELDSLRQSYTRVKEEHDAKFAEISRRYEEEYRGLTQAYRDSLSRRTSRYEGTADVEYGGDRTTTTYRSSRVGRSIPTLPKKNDPAAHPQVVLLKQRMDGYKTQIEDRERWMKEFREQQDKLEGRVAEARAQRERIAEEQEAERRRSEAMARQETDEKERQRAEAERVQAEAERKRLSGEQMAKRMEALRKAAGEVDAHVVAGDFDTALVRVNTVVAEDRAAYSHEPEAAAVVRDMALAIFEAAVEAEDVVTAATALRLAADSDPGGAPTMNAVMVVYSKIREDMRAGRHAFAIRYLTLLDVASRVDAQGCAQQKRDLSRAALDGASAELMSLDIPGAFAAVGLASDLWPMNPKIGTWRVIMVAGCVGLVLAGVYFVAKVLGRASMAWTRR